MRRTHDKPSGVFFPEDIQRLQEALARVWNARRLASIGQDSRQAQTLRETMAKLIIKFASSGVSDPIELSNRALASLAAAKVRRGDLPGVRLAYERLAFKTTSAARELAGGYQGDFLCRLYGMQRWPNI
jgi:hypothetical protein